MTLRQEGAASRSFLQKLLWYETDGVEVLKIDISVWPNQRVEWSKVVLVAVEVSPVGSKPPAAVVVRIFKSERHNLGATAPCLPGHHPLNKGEPEVRSSHYRSW